MSHTQPLLQESSICSLEASHNFGPMLRGHPWCRTLVGGAWVPGSKNKARTEEEQAALQAKKAARAQYKKDVAEALAAGLPPPERKRGRPTGA